MKQTGHMVEPGIFLYCCDNYEGDILESDLDEPLEKLLFQQGKDFIVSAAEVITDEKPVESK